MVVAVMKGALICGKPAGFEVMLPPIKNGPTFIFSMDPPEVADFGI
jgi:hypothetical protein